MNIDDYRAFIAQEKEKQDSQVEQPVVEETTPVEPVTEPPVIETTPTEPESVPEPTVPDTIEIDGVAVPIDELKSGYLRQSDYTRKTQELARERERANVANQYYEAVNSNPELAQEIAKQFNLPYMSPVEAQMADLQTKYQDLLLEKEIGDMKAKYTDFDAKEVLEVAFERKLENLEDAYFIVKSRKGADVPAQPAVDVEALKEELRQELLREIRSNVDTQSIIQTGGEQAPVRDTTITLSAQEAKVARAMKLSPEEYAKWRDQ